MPSTKPAKPEPDQDSTPDADAHEHAAEYGYAVRHGYGPEPDPISGGSAIIAVGDRLEFVSEPDGTTCIDVITPHGDESEQWYRLRLTARSLTVFAIQYVFGGQQSGSGHQQEGADLRQPAGRDADDPDPRGGSAGLPGERGVGALGAVSDTDRDPHWHANDNGEPGHLRHAHDDASYGHTHHDRGYGIAVYNPSIPET